MKKKDETPKTSSTMGEGPEDERGAPVFADLKTPMPSESPAAPATSRYDIPVLSGNMKQQALSDLASGKTLSKVARAYGIAPSDIVIRKR